MGSDSGAVERGCEMLERLGYACTKVEDAAHAASLAREESLDLIVAVGSGVGDFLEKSASTHEGSIWAGSVLVLSDGKQATLSADTGNTSGNNGGNHESENDELIAARVGEMVAVNRLTRRLSDTRMLMNAWKRDISDLAGLDVPGASLGKAASGPLGLARALVSVHDQIRDISLCLDSEEPFSSRCREHQCSVHGELLQALRHTIEILRKTKQSFKSKELGELRSYLEALLNEHS
ncbi:MAG: hypothetical protein WC655_01640 [Candidatus Hydrogenedentales bacterium]